MKPNYFKYVLVWVLVMITFYSQKFVDNMAILSSANEWMSLGTMSMRTDYTESGSPTKDREMNLNVLSSRPTTGSLKASTLFLVHGGSPKYWILKFVKGGGDIFKPPYQSGRRAYHIHHYTRPTVACMYVLFVGIQDNILHKRFLSDVVFQSRSWYLKNEYCFTLLSAQSW